MAIGVIILSTRSAMPINALEGLPGLVAGEDSLLYGSRAALHGGDGNPGAVLDLLDHRGDLAGGLRSGLGQAADLPGDDGKVTAVIACAGRFDGSVQSDAASRLTSWMRMVAAKALSSIARMSAPAASPSFDSSFIGIPVAES